MNPDHALLLDFLRRGDGVPQPVRTNPLAVALGTTLIAGDAGEGTDAATLTLAFSPDDQFVQGNGVIQGGIVAAMLDFATAFVVLMKLPPDRSAVTVSLELRFMRAVHAGRLVAKARLCRLGSTLAFADGELFGADGRNVLAGASAVLPIVAVRGSGRGGTDAPSGGGRDAAA